MQSPLISSNPARSLLIPRHWGSNPNPDAAAPIPYEFIGYEHLLFDLVYNPAETKFLSLGKANGATIKNGFEMLQLQAEAAWEIWNK
jgi:shikimate dehydrogenase